MTALAGFWNFDGQADAGAACAAMLEAQSAYGPDDSALLVHGRLALGRRLFRLLPEDIHDSQPLTAGEGRFVLIADVRLDNRSALSAELGMAPAEAAAMADSRLLLRALLRWGEGALDHITGDYAFAFHDAREERLLLARDPLGQRPLFWHRGKGFIAFASMPVGLHRLSQIPRASDEDSLARYIASMPQRGEHSFYRNIQRVEPGHLMSMRPAAASSRRHWTPRRRELRLARFDDYVDAFRDELDQAVACRLRRLDGGIATHLSGGWDSSAVTATAARLLAPLGGRVSAFTSVPAGEVQDGLPAGRFGDEGPLAAATAAFHPNIDHMAVKNSRRSPIRDLERDGNLFGRPPYNPCNHVWLSDIRGAARAAGAHVLLTGEIGNWTISAAPDGLLANYLREGRWADWWREAKAARHRARLRGIAASSFGPWLPAPLWEALMPLSSGPGPALSTALRDRWRRAIRSGPGAQPPGDYFRHAIQAFAEMDFGEYRKGILAGWGVDKRDATADVRLIEFCLSLPLDMLLKDGKRRPLARAALADRLPAAVLDQTGKGYQAADWHVGLTADRPAVVALVDAIAADGLASDLIDIDLLRVLVRDWPSDGWNAPRTIARYRVALLQALAAGQFAITASRPPPAATGSQS